MRRLLLTFILTLLLSATAGAGSRYVVYSVQGPVYECAGKERTPVAAKTTHLTDNSLIAIGKGGTLTVYIADERCLATITEIGMQRLSTLVGRSRKSGGASARWAAALISSLMKSDTPENTHRSILQSQGASHRGEDDDIMVANAFAAFLSGDTAQDSALSFRLLDADGEPIGKDPLAWPDEAVAEVTNSSDGYLFVNLLAVSPEGERTLIFPIDTDIDNNCCAHLLVPPGSTVAMSALSFFPSLLDSGSRLILVGSPSQINFSALCRTQSYNKSTPAAPLRFYEI